MFVIYTWQRSLWLHVLMRSKETPNGPQCTAPDPKMLWDVIDQTPQRTGDSDTLSQRGYGSTILRGTLYSRGVKYTTLNPAVSKLNFFTGHYGADSP